MQMDKETLIKQHFWILSGLALLLVVALSIVIFVSMPGKVGAEQQKVDKVKKDLDLKSPKNQKWVDVLHARGEKVGGKQNEVWEKAWNTQTDLMTWPEEQKKFEKLYFGDPINHHDRTEYAERYYKTQYEKKGGLAWAAEPYNDLGEPLVQFGGPWDQVLKLVQWQLGRVPDNEEVWLAQEDIWMQRELLRVVREANDMLAIFKEVTELQTADKAKADPAKEDKPKEEKKDAPAKDAPAKDGGDEEKADKDEKKAAEKPKPAAPAPAANPNKKRYTSMHWELDIELTKNDKGRPVFVGQIRNKTSRKLPLSLWLRVKVKPGSTSNVGDAWWPVDGESLAAGETLKLKPSEPLDQYTPEGIFGVRQVLSWRTAPVKRVDMIALGYPSHRLANRKLMTPSFIKPPEIDPLAEGGGEPGMPGAPGAPTGEGGDMGGFGRGMPGMGGVGKANLTPNGLEKDRYIDRTDQVRRMPVGLLMIVDQEHIQTVLTAFANSRLRFQTAQFHAQRYRQSIKPPELGGPGATGTGAGPGETDGDPSGARGRGGEGVEPGMPAGPGGRGGMMLPGMPPGGPGGMMMPGGYGRGMPGMPGMSGSAPPVGELTPGRPGGMMMPGGMTGGMGGLGLGMFGMGQQEMEEEFTLVELGVYGIASLYERFPPKPPAPEGTTDPNAAPAPAN